MLGRLYKYRNLAGCNRQRLEQTLCDSVHWFASPRSFNDPFDCAIVPAMEGSDEERYKYWGTAISFQLARLGHYDLELEFTQKAMRAQIDPFAEILRRARAGELGLTPASLERILADNLARDSEADRDRILEDHQSSIDQLGVLSLSARWDSILMWSHYSDCHRGLCVEFRVDIDSTPFGSSLLTSAEAVDYSAAYPEVSIYAEDIAWYRALLMTKANHWSYEEEVSLHRSSGGGTAALRFQCAVACATRMPDA